MAAKRSPSVLPTPPEVKTRSEDRHARRKILSIVVLVYNEQENLIPFYERLGRVLEQLTRFEVEVIFVDDGSRDNSLAILRALRRDDPRIKVLKLSRNFGSWSAVAAGIHSARGDAVMWITSDLQDPPELIPSMVRPWEDGSHVVWALRTERDDPLPRRLMATVFYKILRRVAVPGYPAMGTDICLMDQRVAKIFGQLRERNRFTQALIMNLGFTQVRVPYKRERRYRGQSKWGNLSRLSKMGIDMVVGTSCGPIRAMTYAGVIMVVSGLGAVAVLLVATAMRRFSVSLWVPIVFSLFVAVGLNAIMLGVLGEYLWRVLEEVRDRPLYIIQERIGFETATCVPDVVKREEEYAER